MSQTDDDFTPRSYRVRHRTSYRYDSEVETCFERGILTPRPTPTQQIVAHVLEVTPEPDLASEHVDFFGNHSHYLEIRSPHRHLDVINTIDVAVDRPRPDMARLNTWTVADASRAFSAATSVGPGEVDPVWSSIYRLPSELVSDAEDVASYARTHIDPEMPLGEALLALTLGIDADLRFQPGVTSVNTTLSQVLELRAGVCQDFSHLAIGCLRSLGLPTRYVSGYIETLPPPGRDKLEGSDATHAWASVMVPDGSWVAIDPTNGQLADSRYVVTAFGRDFADVSPLKGIVHTEAESSTLDVAVDVIRLD